MREKTYYHHEFVLEMYIRVLEDEVKFHEENNPLLWLLFTKDFTYRGRIDGKQNIAHIIIIVFQYPILSRDKILDGKYIGIEFGCILDDSAPKL